MSRRKAKGLAGEDLHSNPTPHPPLTGCVVQEVGDIVCVLVTCSRIDLRSGYKDSMNVRAQSEHQYTFIPLLSLAVSLTLFYHLELL